MNLLLDTHTLIWFLEDNPLLGVLAKNEILSPSNSLFLSLVTYLEIAIKSSLNKLSIQADEHQFYSVLLAKNTALVPIRLQHIHVVQHLPLHHRDPFDRMLIAQALTENLVLVSRDAHFAAYGVALLW